MIKNKTWIKSRITINVGVSAKIQKNILRAKNIIFRIILHVIVKMINMLEILLILLMIHSLSVMRILAKQKVLQKNRQAFHELFWKTSIQNLKTCLTPPFQRTLYLMFHLFQKYLNPEVRTKKIVSSVVYHPCPSRLASRIHPFLFPSTS